MDGQKYFETPPLKFVDLPADKNHYWPGRQSLTRAICLHDTVGTDSRAWLTTTPGSNASAHRLIARDGTIYKLVDDKDTAWTNGPSKMYTSPGSLSNQNASYLTIEMEHHYKLTPDWPEAQIAACARQVVEWWGFVGFLPVVYHWQVQGNKVDPINFPFGVFHRNLVSWLKQCLSVGAH